MALLDSLTECSRESSSVVVVRLSLRSEITSHTTAQASSPFESDKVYHHPTLARRHTPAVGGIHLAVALAGPAPAVTADPELPGPAPVVAADPELADPAPVVAADPELAACCFEHHYLEPELPTSAWTQ